jgi:hypothetical protein
VRWVRDVEMAGPEGIKYGLFTGWSARQRRVVGAAMPSADDMTCGPGQMRENVRPRRDSAARFTAPAINHPVSQKLAASAPSHSPPLWNPPTPSFTSPQPCLQPRHPPSARRCTDRGPAALRTWFPSTHSPRISIQWHNHSLRSLRSSRATSLFCLPPPRLPSPPLRRRRRPTPVVQGTTPSS